MSGKNLLWVDCTAALVAGAAVLLLRGWLANLYALPENLVLIIGVVNVAYGAFSFSLAVARHHRPKFLIYALVFANLSWAATCFVIGAAYLRTASIFGLGHLIGEGVFVGALALLEWRARKQLVIEPDPDVRPDTVHAPRGKHDLAEPGAARDGRGTHATGGP